MSRPQPHHVETTVVYGPMALHARRLQAAESGKLGLQVMTLEQLAAHLAGGFLRPASSEELDLAIRAAFEGGGFCELQDLPGFPGAVRAVARTLQRVWEANLPTADLASSSSRMADLDLIQRRVRQALPCGSLATPDLVQAASERVHLAGRLLGPIELASLPYLAPVWQMLVLLLGGHTQVRWSGPLPLGAEGMPGGRIAEQARNVPEPDIVACADPRHEALEAVRWMRGLLSSGRARPRDIAIAAADPGPWDAVMLAARAGTGLPLHFSHGIPALETRNGQACAALANLLQHGLSRERVRRVLAHCAAAPGLARLPSAALLGVARHAALTEMAHWRVALAAALPTRGNGDDPAPVLLPLLEMGITGLAAAAEAGRLFLPAGARELWAEALRRAPCQALPITLQDLRSADERNPADSVTWGPASHLAAAPRPFVRLLGLNARAWPRQSSDDPLLPSHIVDPSRFGVPAVSVQDRAAFAAIRCRAFGALTLSRSRRNARGNILPPSALLPPHVPVRILERHRIAAHAAGPADRLFLRPGDAAGDAGVATAGACAIARRSPRANAHDGLLPLDHALVRQALEREQSATSLRLLLRDPQGYVWRHVLQWSSPPRDTGQLTLDARSHGELVHEILREAVDALEAGPGYASATVPQMREAVRTAASGALVSWPPRRPTPPRLLWAYTVDVAAEQARRALERDMPLQLDTRSYTEAAFGESGDDGHDGRARPWSVGVSVAIPGTELRFGGSVDRLDIRGDGVVRVTDYKTGDVPKHHGSMVLDGGRELQRVLYALAARTLLPDVQRTRARLAFLREDPALMALLPGIDDAIASASRHLLAAARSLSQGNSLPGPDAEDKWADRRLGLPAMASGYFSLKRNAFSQAFTDLRQAWSAR